MSKEHLEQNKCGVFIASIYQKSKKLRDRKSKAAWQWANIWFWAYIDTKQKSGNRHLQCRGLGLWSHHFNADSSKAACLEGSCLSHKSETSKILPTSRLPPDVPGSRSVLSQQDAGVSLQIPDFQEYRYLDNLTLSQPLTFLSLFFLINCVSPSSSLLKSQSADLGSESMLQGFPALLVMFFFFFFKLYQVIIWTKIHWAL